ncbi:MAG: hypothetical protein KDE62_04535, partial [Calditrichaeota bacterium]|nr:hypothetical protein [Calditrichota bacterium]
SAGEGQGNIIATTTITNGDSLTSSAKIQALNALLNPNDGSVTAVLEVPSPLPTLLGGQSVNVRYRLSVANPAPSSQVAMQVR